LYVYVFKHRFTHLYVECYVAEIHEALSQSETGDSFSIVREKERERDTHTMGTVAVGSAAVGNW